MATSIEYQAKPRLKAVPAVYLIMQNKSGRILLALRKDTGYQDGRWDLPAGHVEEGELPTDAVVREIFEETGVYVCSDDLALVHTSYRTKHDRTGDRVDLFFKTDKWQGQPRIGEPDKCAAIDWFDISALLQLNMVPHVRFAVLSWRYQGRSFSEHGVRWLKNNHVYEL